MKKNTKSIIINLIISALIGFIVGLVEISLRNFTTNDIYILLVHSLIGLLIGSVIRQTFIITYGKLKVYQIFILSSILLGVISMFSAIIDCFIFKKPLFRTTTIIIIITAELLGMSFTFASYKYYRKLNQKLDEKKKELLERLE
ncbi:hypothetical protein [Tepidibacter hydrothermalis]|uniref:DUF3021 domain-containing protein n=1 Tax=Tepidibacter hydrothermalis TaxID=3036126 RepID=A0ABY8EEX4_9FIRM|nr:hypothetical protein [Tepidibacter hydrothermalis]WFD11497.1 hypothetical protein P4S50_05325 [Tepidibacter hydrothermalis]